MRNVLHGKEGKNSAGKVDQKPVYIIKEMGKEKPQREYKRSGKKIY